MQFDTNPSEQVEPQEKAKVPKGRALKRLKYTRRFVNVTLTGGKRKVRTTCAASWVTPCSHCADEPQPRCLSATHDKANARNVKIGKGFLSANLGNDGRDVCDESRLTRKAEGNPTTKDLARRCDGGLTRRQGVHLSNEYIIHQHTTKYDLSLAAAGR
jgi:Ribosomal protein S30